MSVMRAGFPQAWDSALLVVASSSSSSLSPSPFSLRTLALPPCLVSRHPPSRTPRDVLCMAHPRRVKMVAQQIKREIGDMLIKDKVLQHAIFPETAVGADMYLSSLATISDVVISNDLQVAKVYVSIYSDERGKEIVMDGLKAKTKHVRACLGKRMQLRLTPEVRFIMDESLERGSRVLAILDRLRKEREEGQVGKKENDDEEHDNWDDILNGEEEVKKAASKQRTKNIGSSEDGGDSEEDYKTEYGDDEKIVFIR